ncbi:MAG TPA: type II secretion system F family protein [Anaerolineaceae bacterium]
MNISLLILIFGGSIALIMLFVGIIVTVTSDRKTVAVEERLGRYAGGERGVERVRPERQPIITEWMNKRLQGSSMGEKISRNLARADLRLKPGEYIALILIAAFGVGFVAWFFGGRYLIVGILGAIVGSFIPGMYVKSQQGKRLERFGNQLSDMLNLMVNGLRAGYSTMQAMEAVSKELPSPISDEFRRVVQEIQLGVPMEKALDNLLRRIPSEDLDLVVTAINVQREVGGNLAEILDVISFTIRERVRIKGEIKVLTTQTMYSGRALSLMPVFVLVILYFLNRDYMMEFFSPKNNATIPCGYIALGIGVILIVAGYFVMNKIAQIEV